jgi:ankyrin repeat protein
MAMFMQSKDTGEAGVPAHLLSSNQIATPSSSALYEFASKGNIEGVRASLVSDGKPNWFNPDANGATSLHAAARAKGNDATTVVAELVAYGAVLDVKTITTQNTPLHEAILANNQSAAETLISAGSLFEQNSFGNTPLLLAAQQGNIGIALSLLKRGHPISTTNNQRRTALHIAANLCQEEPSEFSTTTDLPSDNLPKDRSVYINLAACLIMYKNDVNAADANGYTPLHAAAARGNLDMVRLLVDSGADLEAKSKMYVGSRLTERTAFEVADLRNHKAVTTYLKSCADKVKSGEVVATGTEKARYARGYVSQSKVAVDENSTNKINVAPVVAKVVVKEQNVGAFAGSGVSVAKGSPKK